MIKNHLQYSSRPRIQVLYIYYDVLLVCHWLKIYDILANGGVQYDARPSVNDVFIVHPALLIEHTSSSVWLTSCVGPCLSNAKKRFYHFHHLSARVQQFKSVLLRFATGKPCSLSRVICFGTAVKAKFSLGPFLRLAILVPLRSGNTIQYSASFLLRRRWSSQYTASAWFAISGTKSLRSSS